jgi:hypothetical protein
MRRFAALLALVIFFQTFVAPSQADTRVALVISNGAYQNAPRLPNPRNDATDVAAALKRSRFDIISGLDLDKAAMDDAAVRFARAARIDHGYGDAATIRDTVKKEMTAAQVSQARQRKCQASNYKDCD